MSAFNGTTIQKKMSEATAWSTLRGHLKRKGIHMQRIEDSMSAGIPDCYVQYRGGSVWLEGKFVRSMPKLKTTKLKVGLRAEQATWLEGEVLAGGRAGVWIRVLDGGWFWREGAGVRELVDGVYPDELERFSTAKEMAERILEWRR